MASDGGFGSSVEGDVVAIRRATPEAQAALIERFLDTHHDMISAVARRSAARCLGVDWDRDGSEVTGLVALVATEMLASGGRPVEVVDGWATLLLARSRSVVRHWQQDRVSRLLAAGR